MRWAFISGSLKKPVLKYTLVGKSKSREQKAPKPDRAAAPPVDDAEVLKALQSFLKDQPSVGEKPPAAAEETLTKAPLEHRSDVAGRDRLNYRRNFTEQYRIEQGEALSRESEFAATWRGRFSRWPISRWLFDRKTRRLEILIFLGVVTAVLGVWLSVVLSSREVEMANNPVAEIVEPIPDMGEELLAGREASEAVIKEFFMAKSIEAVRPLIRHPEALATVMKRWYDTHDYRQEANIEFDSVRIKELDGARYYLHFVRLTNDTEARPIAVEEAAQGYRVDWETAVGYQAMDWDELQKKRPSETVYMRVVARVDDYYNYEFRDSAAWSCFRLTHPDGDNALYGYVKRYSDLDQQLRNGMGEDETSSDYFILGVSYPVDSESSELVHIDEILQTKWVRDYVNHPRHFDER